MVASYGSIVEFFCRKILRNGIATKENLTHRGVNVSTGCELCNSGEEDVQHLFWFCVMAKQIWRSRILGIHSEIHGDIPFVEWMMSYIQLFERHDGHTSKRTIYFIITMWSIWVARNNTFLEMRM